MTSFCKSILKNCVYHGKKSILKNWLIFAKKELLIVFYFWNVIVFRCLKEIYIWKKMKIIFSKIFACSTAIEPAGWELSIKNHFVNPENPRGQIKRGSTWQDFFSNIPCLPSPSSKMPPRPHRLPPLLAPPAATATAGGRNSSPFRWPSRARRSPSARMKSSCSFEISP